MKVKDWLILAAAAAAVIVVLRKLSDSEPKTQYWEAGYTVPGGSGAGGMVWV